MTRPSDSALCVLGIDPGKMTGLAFWVDGRWDALQLPAKEASQWINTWIASHSQCSTSIECGYSTPAVACEVFTNSARVLSSQPHARQIYGHVEAQCLSFDVAFYGQRVAAAKNVVPNELLKRMGIYRTNMKHAMDATRHVVWWLHKHHPDILRPMKNNPRDL